MSNFPCANFWIANDGTPHWALHGHEIWAMENVKARPEETDYDAAYRAGYLRGFFIGGNHLYVDGSVRYPRWESLPRAVKQTLEDFAFKYDRQVEWTGFGALRSVVVIERPTKLASESR